MFLQIMTASIIGSVFAMVGGVFLLWKEEIAKKFSLFLVAFAVGSLLGAAFFELIPEALEEMNFHTISPLILLGLFTVFIFEKLLKWYHCHDQEKCDYHTFSGTVLFGDAVHNFVDGVAIALSFAIDFNTGIATTIAVFFHEVPQEIGDFGVLLHSGYTKVKVLFYNLLTALTTPLGAFLGFLALPYFTSKAIAGLIAFGAGSFIYIAVSDLMPELRHRTSSLDLGHLLSIIGGIAIIWILGIILPE